MSGPPLELCAALASDLDEIVALEQSTENAPHWPRAAYAEIITAQPSAPQRCLFIVRANGALAGFAVGLLQSSVSHPSRIAELESVAVAGSARRTGIGRALCDAVLDWSSAHGASEIALEVRAASADAIALYAGLGFVQIGRRPRYYHDPVEDALLMQLQLEPSSRSAQE